jgi:hypothetical protein
VKSTWASEIWALYTSSTPAGAWWVRAAQLGDSPQKNTACFDSPAFCRRENPALPT